MPLPEEKVTAFALPIRIKRPAMRIPVMPAIKLKSRQAFTLLELLLVVAVIGILVGIAIPNYQKAKEHALGREAISTLKIIAAAEKIFKIETNGFAACGCFNNGTSGSGATDAGCNNVNYGCNKVLNLDLSAESWQYAAVPDNNSGGFYVDAQRQGGGADLCKYRLANDYSDGEPRRINGTCYQ